MKLWHILTLPPIHFHCEVINGVRKNLRSEKWMIIVPNWPFRRPLLYFFGGSLGPTHFYAQRGKGWNIFWPPFPQGQIFLDVAAQKLKKFSPFLNMTLERSGAGEERNRSTNRPKTALKLVTSRAFFTILWKNWLRNLDGPKININC